MNALRYSPATDYIVYNGSFWEESKPKAQGIAQELTTRQLEEAELEIENALDEMNDNGALDIVMEYGAKKAADHFKGKQEESYERYEATLAYRKYVIGRRDSKR